MEKFVTCRSPDTGICVFDMSYDGLRVRTCPTFEDNRLQLGGLRLGSDIGWGQNWFASDSDDGGNGGVTKGQADDLGADKAGGTCYDELHFNGLPFAWFPHSPQKLGLCS